MKKVYLLLLLFMGISSLAIATDYVTVAPGKYTDMATWGTDKKDMPGLNITNGDRVIVNHSVDFEELKITNDGVFIVKAEVTGLSIDVPGGEGKGTIFIEGDGVLKVQNPIDPPSSVKYNGTNACTFTETKPDGTKVTWYGTCNGTLPVNLLYFNATAESSAVEINWASSKAWDFSHYELERSADGKAFEYVATIDAEEVTNSVVEYSYSDRQPISGTSYYRLKAVDIDGAFEYKNVTLVKFGAEIFKVFPNPSNLGYINISWSHATEGARVSLKDNMGRSVLANTLSANQTTISTEGLTPGVYLLSVQGAAGIQQSQVLVQ